MNTKQPSIFTIKTITVLCFVFLRFYQYGQAQPSQFFNVKTYGASGQKSDLATIALQKAINACAQAGGGVVYFPPGDYLSGTIRLKDNVTLHLEAGATLFASQDEKDYQVPYTIYKHNNPNTPVLIYAKGATNIGIKGKGQINGQARHTYGDYKAVDNFIAEEIEIAQKAGVEMKKYYKVKPLVGLVHIADCQDIRIEDIYLAESPVWTLHVQWSERVWIRGCRIFTDLEKGANADGIDIDGCRDVVISDCIIETGDDAIVLKTTRTNGQSQPCENVTVSNCVLTSTSTALKLGTESYADFNNIVFNNCAIKNTNRGLSIVVRDGARVSDVIFSNITLATDRKHFNWWGSGDPIWLVVLKRTPESKVGTIENVRFENIIAHGQGTSKLEGYAGAPLKNINLTNVQLFMQPEDTPDKRATHALATHDVEQLTLSDVSVHWSADQTEAKWGSALYAENIHGLRIFNLSGRQGLLQSDHPALHLHNVQQAIVKNTMPTQGTKLLLKISGKESQNIYLSENDPLQRAKTPLKVSSEVREQSITKK